MKNDAPDGLEPFIKAWREETETPASPWLWTRIQAQIHASAPAPRLVSWVYAGAIWTAIAALNVLVFVYAQSQDASRAGNDYQIEILSSEW